MLFLMPDISEYSLLIFNLRTEKCLYELSANEKAPYTKICHFQLRELNGSFYYVRLPNQHQKGLLKYYLKYFYNVLYSNPY